MARDDRGEHRFRGAVDLSPTATVQGASGWYLPHLGPGLRLHTYLARRHVRDGALIGPDSGIRYNYRIGRFAKSYLCFLSWLDDYYYLQAQGYWILANWRLSNLRLDPRYAELAVAASRQVAARQRPDGSWEYPNPEWSGRVATVEGTWACLGLLETYRRTGDREYLAPVRRWHTFLDGMIGYVDIGGASAVNYFAHRRDLLVPNNSACVLRFLAELDAVAGTNNRLVKRRQGLLNFLRHAQLTSGELPYALPLPGQKKGRHRHFQCFQYNAFQCLDLLRFYELTDEPSARDVILGLVSFLKEGLTSSGNAYYDCHRGRRTVTYHTAAVATALAEASRLGVTDHGPLAARTIATVLAQQQPNGSFPFSRGDYLVLQDTRGYPRNLSMILYHLLSPEEGKGTRHE